VILPINNIKMKIYNELSLIHIFIIRIFSIPAKENPPKILFVIRLFVIRTN